MSTKPIGILGGMGPGAGVYFKQLIVEMTPATCDQEHVSTVLYTNPQIPDRTEAVLQGKTNSFVREISAGLQKLDQFGVVEIFIPCNTSFVGYAAYRSHVNTPIYHLPQRTTETLRVEGVSSALLLATQGTYESGVYNTSHNTVSVSVPNYSEQKLIHSLIIAVKSGDVQAQERLFLQVVDTLPITTESVILGCTELSMLSNQFRAARPDINFADPLEIASRYIIEKYSSVTYAALV